MLTDYGEVVYNDALRPSHAPNEKEDYHWRTPEEPEGLQPWELDEDIKDNVCTRCGRVKGYFHLCVKR